MATNTTYLCIVSFALFCAACGGGGRGDGNDNGAATPPSPPAANQAPTVDAGADQTVDEETAVNLSATGADSDGTIVSYSWVQEEGQENGLEVTLTDADTANASFVAPMLTGGCGRLSFRVTVTDDDGATGSDIVSVKVLNADPPTLSTARFGRPAAGCIGRLGELAGGDFKSEVFGGSGGGSVVGGRSEATGGREAFRWTAASGMIGLGDLPGGEFNSTAKAASSDGSVVVGYGVVGDGCCQEAFHWTTGTDMVSLGQLPGSALDSEAHEVSADGSVIVGNAVGAEGGSEAFLWTSAGGMMGLGYLPGFDDASRAFGVSADGTVVVGQSKLSCCGSEAAFVWTQADGMRSLHDILIGKGVTGLDNWELRMASSISADGSWVAGYGINPSGIGDFFLANISAP
jgi:probable HAF family extracellular repeat protein